MCLEHEGVRGREAETAMSDERELNANQSEMTGRHTENSQMMS